MVGERVVYLHVGAMKTGTTYLQQKMAANRAELAAQGVLWPGRTWADQVRAVQDLLDMGEKDPELALRSAGRWERLTGELAARDEPVAVLSMEFLSFADARRARRAISSLRPDRVDVILTVRDSTAVVPALWQTAVTSGGRDTWESFMAGTRTAAKGSGRVSRVTALAGDPTARRFREALHLPHILKVWLDAAGPDHVHVVTVPRPGAPPDALWERFAAVIGADPDGTPHPPRHVNESIGYPSAELVRRINEELQLSTLIDHNKTVKDHLALTYLARRRDQERRAELDGPTREAMLAWNATVREAITAAGVEVAGSLEDLPVTGRDEVEPTPAPGEEELLAAAATAYRPMRALVRRRARVIRSAEKRRRRLRRLQRRLTGPAGWAAAPDPVTAAVGDLAQLSRTAIKLRRKRVRRRLGRDALR